MSIQGYVDEDEIVDFMQIINSDFTEDDINELIVNSMYDMINRKMDTVYETTTTTLLADGHGTYTVWCPKIPIVDITRIAIINQDETEDEFDISGDDRNIWWDTSTGKIFTKRDYENKIEVYPDDESLAYGKFPDRVACVKIEGTFGQVANSLVKQLQLFLILKQYAILQPSVYATDIISEKIGRYEYKLLNASNVSPNNQRKGIDGWIAYLFEQLPSEDKLGLESI